MGKNWIDKWIDEIDSYKEIAERQKETFSIVKENIEALNKLSDEELFIQIGKMYLNVEDATLHIAQMINPNAYWGDPGTNHEQIEALNLASQILAYVNERFGLLRKSETV